MAEVRGRGVGFQHLDRRAVLVAGPEHALVHARDRDAILEAASMSRTRKMMTVEEHNVIGGLGGAVAEVLSETGGSPPLHRHGIRDEYALIGPPTHLYRHYRLDADGIVAEAETPAHDAKSGGETRVSK